MDAAADAAPNPSAVLAAFRVPGRVVDMVALPNAWSNRVYRLTTDRHQRFAVKELRNPWKDPRWRDWLDAAWDYEQRAFAAGVRMPEPIPNPIDGGCVAWVERTGGEAPAPDVCTSGWTGAPSSMSPSRSPSHAGPASRWRFCTS